MSTSSLDLTYFAARRAANQSHAPQYQEMLDNLSEYAKDKVEKVLREMLYELLIATPQDPIQFMIEFLQQYKERDNDIYEEDEIKEPPDHLESLPVMDTDSHILAQRFDRGKRRVAVSAETESESDMDSQPFPVIEKSVEDNEHIRAAITHNILFNGLDQHELKTVIDSMDCKEYPAGSTIIQQGEPGDHFYVLDRGVCECYLKLGKNEPKLVKTYNYGESFGELALMYGAPRAATIKAKTDVKVWVMHRMVFRRILMKTTSSKRKKYEAFLSKVPLLASLDKYERSVVADALIDLNFKDGECIIAQGDRGHNMYFIIEGGAVATKVLPGSDQPQTVMTYQPGEYFGELALLSDNPRAANVYAVGDTHCVYLDRDSFNRLLGPCEEILKRNTENYRKIERKIMEQKLRGESAGEDVKEEETRTQYQRRAERRKVVSSEPTNHLNTEFTPVKIPKTSVDENEIRAAVSANILFSSLDQDALKTCVDAMFERKYNAGDTIIRQGDQGDNFYLVKSGVCECYVQKNKEAPRLVKTYSRGESFGELALMYNAPRAATIQAKTETVLYGLDRVTFRRLIMDIANQKRDTFDSFLSKVPILSSLDDYERHTIADALKTIHFKSGDYIIRQGETGDNFYFVVKGRAKATKKIDGEGEEVEVYSYGAGDYFGELALIHSQPRAANVIALDHQVECVYIDRASFVRLLGPVEEILQRNKQNYTNAEQRIKSQQSAKKDKK